jgi:predicted nucleotidyltransferase
MADRNNLNMPQKRIAEFCKRNHIRKFSLFGSAIRDDFGPDSDLDVLVEFDPSCVPGLIKLAGMEIELGEICGRKVDLRTAEDLSKYFRQDIVKTAEVQYAEG